MIRFRDLERLSAYLDGKLDSSESARVESRLKADREYTSAYEDMRQAKSVLRQLPFRKSPRNFTLTKKMVGLKPPLPRVYPTFKFATAFATALLAVTFAVNSFSAAPSAYDAAPAAMLAAGQGGGGDGTLEAPMLAAEAPAPTISAEESSTDAAGTERIRETPTAKDIPSESPNQTHSLEATRRMLIPLAWQGILIALILIGWLALFWMKQAAKRKWRNEQGRTS